MTNVHVMETKSVVAQDYPTTWVQQNASLGNASLAERKSESVTNPQSIYDLLSLAPITRGCQMFSIFISHSCVPGAVVMESFLGRTEQEAEHRWSHLICSHYPNTILRNIHFISPSFSPGDTGWSRSISPQREMRKWLRQISRHVSWVVFFWKFRDRMRS